jgi:hypothetical protein
VQQALAGALDRIGAVPVAVAFVVLLAAALAAARRGRGS